jgi:hypothetical protein
MSEKASRSLNDDEWQWRGDVRVRLATPQKRRRRRDPFFKFHMSVRKRLIGARGTTWAVATWILYLSWKSNSKVIKLGNVELREEGVSRYAKYRALDSLEKLGLFVVERKGRKASVIRLVDGQPDRDGSA